MEYKVGRPKIIFALLNMSYILFMAYFLMMSAPWLALRIFGVILIVIAFTVILPGLVYCQIMWKVDDNKLYYTYYRTFLDKILSFFTFVKKRKHIYQITINLEQIDFIEVTYSKSARAPFGGIGYDLLFIVHTFDGSLYTFESLVTRNRKDFCNAVEYIQSQGIEFVDSYQILDYLKKGSYLSYYLEELEAKQHD